MKKTMTYETNLVTRQNRPFPSHVAALDILALLLVFGVQMLFLLFIKDLFYGDLIPALTKGGVLSLIGFVITKMI